MEEYQLQLAAIGLMALVGFGYEIYENRRIRKIEREFSERCLGTRGYVQRFKQLERKINSEGKDK